MSFIPTRRKHSNKKCPVDKTKGIRGFTALLIALVAFLFSFDLYVPAAVAQPPTGGPTVAITTLSPEILEEQEEVSFSLEIEAATQEQLVGARVGLYVHADPFTSAAEVDSFLEHGRTDSWSIEEVALTEEEAKQGASGGLSIRMTIPVESLPLWNENAWGPYGVTVRILPPSYTWNEDLPQARTLLLWYPEGSSGTSRVNVTVTDIAEAWEPTQWGSLSDPGVTLALSPGDLAAGLEAGAPQNLEVASIPDEGASLSLLAATEQKELYDLAAKSRFLPDSAVETSANSGNTESAQPQSDQQSGDANGKTQEKQFADALRSARISLIEDVIIADKDWFDLRLLKASKASTVLTPPEGLRELFTSAVTPSSRFLVDPQTGLMTPGQGGISNGPNLTATLLDSWNEASNALSDKGRITGNEVTDRQRVRAISSIAARHSDGTLSLWTNVSAESLGEHPRSRLNELLNAPWVTPVSLRTMLSSPLSSVMRQPIQNYDSVSLRKTREQLIPLTDELLDAQAVLEARIVDSTPADAGTKAVLRATAANLNETTRQERISKAIVELSELTDSIHILPSGTINIVGRNAPFPVTLKNEGPYPLEVEVGLQASDPRLSTRRWTTVAIPSEGSVSTQVPVEAVGTGQVTVNVLAQTSSGTLLDTSAPITVRVRAGWEGPGIWIIGGLLAAAFLVGLTKTIKKGQRRMSTPQQTSPRSDV